MNGIDSPLRIHMDENGEYIASPVGIASPMAVKMISGHGATPQAAVRELLVALIMVIESLQDELKDLETSRSDADRISMALVDVGLAGVRYVSIYETTQADDESRMAVGDSLWHAVKQYREVTGGSER